MSASCIRISGHGNRQAPAKRLDLLRQLLSSYIRHSDERFEYGSVEYASLATLFLGSDDSRPAQPELRCNPTLPARKLSYDEDTVLTLPSDYTKAAPLPDGTHVRFAARADGQKQPVASIPSEWLLALPTDAFLLHDALGHPCQVRFEYKLSGVQRDTVVGMIEADVAEFLCGQLKGLPRKPHLVYQTVTAEGTFEYETVDPDATAQHEDLFCRSREIIVTNLPLTQLPRDALQQQRAFASQGAGNTRPAAPEHNRMLNNLIGEDHSKHKEGTRLPTSAADWRKLRNHLNAIGELFLSLSLLGPPYLALPLSSDVRRTSCSRFTSPLHAHTHPHACSHVCSLPCLVFVALLGLLFGPSRLFTTPKKSSVFTRLLASHICDDP